MTRTQKPKAPLDPAIKALLEGGDSDYKPGKCEKFSPKLGRVVHGPFHWDGRAFVCDNCGRLGAL